MCGINVIDCLDSDYSMFVFRNVNVSDMGY